MTLADCLVRFECPTKLRMKTTWRIEAKKTHMVNHVIQICHVILGPHNVRNGSYSNNMLTVDKTQFLDQQKYFEANMFSTCDINSNRLLFSALQFNYSFSQLSCERRKSEYFVVDAAVIR